MSVENNYGRRAFGEYSQRDFLQAASGIDPVLPHGGLMDEGMRDHMGHFEEFMSTVHKWPFRTSFIVAGGFSKPLNLRMDDTRWLLSRVRKHGLIDIVEVIAYGGAIASAFDKDGMRGFAALAYGLKQEIVLNGNPRNCADISIQKVVERTRKMLGEDPLVAKIHDPQIEVEVKDPLIESIKDDVLREFLVNYQRKVLHKVKFPIAISKFNHAAFFGPLGLAQGQVRHLEHLVTEYSVIEPLYVDGNQEELYDHARALVFAGIARFYDAAARSGGNIDLDNIVACFRDAVGESRLVDSFYDPKPRKQSRRYHGVVLKLGEPVTTKRTRIRRNAKKNDYFEDEAYGEDQVEEIQKNINGIPDFDDEQLLALRSWDNEALRRSLKNIHGHPGGLVPLEGENARLETFLIQALNFIYRVGKEQLDGLDNSLKGYTYRQLEEVINYSLSGLFQWEREVDGLPEASEEQRQMKNSLRKKGNLESLFGGAVRKFKKLQGEKQSENE